MEFRFKTAIVDNLIVVHTRSGKRCPSPKSVAIIYGGTVKHSPMQRCMHTLLTALEL
jgi:hypothetical protein